MLIFEWVLPFVFALWGRSQLWPFYRWGTEAEWNWLVQGYTMNSWQGWDWFQVSNLSHPSDQTDSYTAMLVPYSWIIWKLAEIKTFYKVYTCNSCVTVQNVIIWLQWNQWELDAKKCNYSQDLMLTINVLVIKNFQGR